MSDLNRFKEKTAVAIITCNREDFFKKNVESIDRDVVGKIYVVNNGDKYTEYPDDVKVLYSQRKPTPVGIGKNKALREMKNDGYEFLFLMEDDVIIKDSKVFEKYIDTALDSGLWAGQLSYGLHGGIGGGNVNADGTPAKRATVQYSKFKVDLYRNSFQAFTLYHAQTLQHIGYMDERYINAAEHLDHYLVAYNKGLGSCYWWFPDIENSYEYIQDQDSNHEKSAIRSQKDFLKDFSYSWQLFKSKFGVHPHQIEDQTQVNVLAKLEELERQFSKKDLLQ